MKKEYKEYNIYLQGRKDLKKLSDEERRLQLQRMLMINSRYGIMKK